MPLHHEARPSEREPRPTGPIKGAKSAALWFCAGGAVPLLLYAAIRVLELPSLFAVLNLLALFTVPLALAFIVLSKLSERLRKSALVEELAVAGTGISLGLFLFSYLVLALH